MQFVVHYFLHFIFPAIVAYAFYRPQWRAVYLLLMATMLVDLDHLLANPVYQACRCSIGFHPLHSYIACGVYACLLLWPKARVLAIGLLMHMATDGIDCLMSRYDCG